LDDLEILYGRVAVARLASFLTCSEFGLSETELLELLMPTSNSAATLSLPSGNYNFSTLCAVRRRMSELRHLSGPLSLSLLSSIVLSSLCTVINLFASSIALFLPCVQVFVRTCIGVNRRISFVNFGSVTHKYLSTTAP
jgi:hypothetical protein